MKRTSYITVLALAAISVCGCQNELDPARTVKAISFSPSVKGTENSEVTKASDLRSTDGSMVIPLWLNVSDGIADQGGNGISRLAAPDSVSPETKGEQLNPNYDRSGDNEDLSLYTAQIGGKFYVAGWKEAGRIPSSGSYDEVSYSGGAWASLTGYDWDGSDPMTFFAYANLPDDIASVANEDSESQTLTYSTVPTSAAEQQDILMGFYSGNGTVNNTARTCTAPIVFYHPLTAVRFKKGSFEGMDDIKFKAIYINRTYKSGTATMTPESIAETDPGDKFVWTDLSTEMQEVSQESDTDLLDAESGIIGEPFLIIPQNLEDTPVTITVVAEIDGALNAFTTTCDSGMWKAGCTNTYSLSKEGYEWEYSFSAEWEFATFTENRDYSESNSNSIYSFRTRSDDSSIKEHVNWIVKSYKIGNGEEIAVGNKSFDYGDAWIKGSGSYYPSGESDILNITAKKADMLAKGKNAYWTNTDGRTDDLGWSPADWSDKDVLDLSKIDVYSDSPANAHGMTTANCYIVRHSGTYMLPLVYGNAMQGGTEIVHTYCTEDISGGQDRLARFVNHKNAGIQSGYIENNAGCIAQSCGILWQSDAAVITDLEFVGNRPSVIGGFNSGNVRYLKFKVDKTTVEQSNALIAVMDENDDIIWSWHIWITNNPEVISDPIPVTNYYGNEYDFFPVDNIGTISSAEYIPRPDIILTLQQEGPEANTLTMRVSQMQFEAKTSSLMYEWGRKDPFLKKNTDYAGNTILSYVQDPDSGVASGILNPLTWYGFDIAHGSSAEYEWATPLYANLWTGIKSAYGDNVFEQDATTIKTIYDPSPVGYQVPTIGAYSGFDTRVGKHGDFSHEKDCWNVVDTIFDNGYEFYTSLGPGHTVNTTGPTISFHADGMRAGNGAAFRSERGWYHASGLYESSDAAIFMIESTEVTSYSTASPSNGYSVRPVLEKP